MENDRQEFLARLPVEEHKALKSLAFFTDRSMNDIVCEAVRSHLATEGRAAYVSAVVETGRSEMRDLLDKLAD